MRLTELTFWISPLTKTLFAGVANEKRNTATQKRDVTGLILNGVVDWMISNEHDYYTVERNGKKYRISLDEMQVTA